MMPTILLLIRENVLKFIRKWYFEMKHISLYLNRRKTYSIRMLAFVDSKIGISIYKEITFLTTKKL